MMEAHEAAKLVECPNELCRHPVHIEVTDVERYDAEEDGKFLKVVSLKCEDSGNTAQVLWRGERGLSNDMGEIGIKGDMELATFGSYDPLRGN